MQRTNLISFKRQTGVSHEETVETALMFLRGTFVGVKIKPWYISEPMFKANSEVNRYMFKGISKAGDILKMTGLKGNIVIESVKNDTTVFVEFRTCFTFTEYFYHFLALILFSPLLIITVIVAFTQPKHAIPIMETIGPNIKAAIGKN